MKLLKTASLAALMSVSSMASADILFEMGNITADDTVGWHVFTLTQDTMVDIDVISTSDMDPDSFLFANEYDTMTGYISGDLLAENDNADYSNGNYNSHMEIWLTAGSYVIATGDYNMEESDARMDYHDDYVPTYGTYEVTVSAVPEPSVLALMFGGLGLVGLMARRSRKA